VALLNSEDLRLFPDYNAALFSPDLVFNRGDSFPDRMCGIFGIIAQNAGIPEGLVERATESLAHRGPDDSGTILLRDASPSGLTEVGLGNRRLAILDLSPLAHQPMQDSATGNWIVYNGEIYNFREVRRELQESGVPFVSQSDTEVLLQAYARWGQACLAKLRGMFAFALWDARQQCLFLARDPMGIKPLYYAQAGGYFLFASELRTLLGTDLIPRTIDPAGVVDYLTFGSAYDPLTLIDGIRALPAGHSLTWTGGKIKEERYWDLVDEQSPEQDPDLTDSGPQLSGDKLRPILEEAVRLQLVSDVPVGVFLSGGIDSSALVSVLSQGGVKPSTFSIIFNEAEFSEAPYSRAIARMFHTDHHEISVSQADVLASVPEALSAMDLPTMDGVNTFIVSREARRAGVKVALSGLGGDEVFAGYASFRSVPKLERFVQFWRRVPAGIRGPLTATYDAFSGENDQSRKLLALARENGRILHPYFLSRMLFTPAQRDGIFPQARGALDLALSGPKSALQRALSLDPVNRVSYLESRCYMLNTLLRDTDFMSMSQGLEVRVPLIDHRLAKAVLGVPGRWKLDRTPKKLLLAALTEKLPDEIIHRRKRGFTLPFDHWMRQEMRALVEPALTSTRVNDGPLGALLNGERTQAVWADFLRGAVSWSRPWSLYVLQRWCELNL